MSAIACKNHRLGLDQVASGLALTDAANLTEDHEGHKGLKQKQI